MLAFPEGGLVLFNFMLIYSGVDSNIAEQIRA